MTKIVKNRLVLATSKAESGVDYTARSGATCPWCGSRTRIYKTMPWEDDARVRYHRCVNVRCPLAGMAKTIKSIEVG